MALTKGELPDSCDVVVIGSGIGGLISAALMARHGLKVCVVEREVRPGGYLAGFSRRKFIFDTAIHWLNQCGPGDFVRRMLEHVGPDAPATPPLKRIRRYKGDSSDYLLTDTPDLLKAELIRDFPQDAKGIEKFFTAAKLIGNRMSDMADHMRTQDTMSFVESAMYGLHMAKWSMPFWKYVSVTAEKGLNKHFPNSEDLRKVWPSEQMFMSLLVPVGWAYMHDYQAPPEGGSQAFVEFLCRRIVGFGSNIVMRAGVERVLLDDNRAVGVRLENGRELRARYVVAAMDAMALFEHLLPPGTVPDQRIEALKSAECYESSFAVSLGIDCDPREIGFNEEVIFLTRDSTTRHDRSNSDPNTVGINILAPSVRDATLAPEGKGTLVIFAPATIDHADRWKTGSDFERGPEYKTFKRAHAEALLDRVQNAISPELREHIEVIDIATPVTLQRYTGNRDGSIMGQLASRPNIKQKVARYRTPVENLFLGGHWAEYGGGVPIATKAGTNSALIVLQKENPAGFEALRGVVDGNGAEAKLNYS